MQQNSFYVYLFLDPRNAYIPFYVGKGKGQRAYSHCNPERNNIFTSAVIKKINLAGYIPTILIWERNLTEERAFAIERELIQRFGRRSIHPAGILTNLTDGGEGLSGHVFSEDHRRKLGEANRGKVVSDETRKKLSVSRTGTKASDETRAKLRNIHKGKNAGAQNPMYGRTGVLHPNYGVPGLVGKMNGMHGRCHSKESIAKMSDSRRSRPNPPRGSLSPNASRDIYEFCHQDGRLFHGSFHSLAEQENIPYQQLYNLVRAKQRTCKGWSIR